MERHTTTGRWRLGLGLAVFTALLWGVLPLVLKLLLDAMDLYTITWYRFLVASVLLGIFEIWRRGFRSVRRCTAFTIGLLLFAAVFLSGNYVIYLAGLDRLTPGTAQVVIQLAPVFLMLGGVTIFRERFTGIQTAGLSILMVGLILFFNQRFRELLQQLSDYTIGVLLIVVAALSWAAYGLAQKQLLRTLPSGTVLLVIYLLGTIVFLPTAEPAQLMEMNAVEIGLLAFAALNTLVAYGCFAESLQHWAASRTGAVLAATPLLTLLAVEAGAVVFPRTISPEQLNAAAMIGALLVVGGSVLCALGKVQKEETGGSRDDGSVE